MKLTQLLLAAGTLFTFSQLTPAAELKLDIYNPGNKSIFPVSSEIISGDNEMVLIDAQFQKNDAVELVKILKKLNKKLTTIYISHSDPDYYFGLDTLQQAFPDAKIIATAQTVEAIKASQQGKLAYWGPILKEQAPNAVVIPEVIEGNSFSIEGKKLIIHGLEGATPDRTVVWSPDLKAVVGGVVVSDNIHLWIADTQTKLSRQQWLQTLESIKALKPEIVVPGHFTGSSKMDIGTVTFSQNYLNAFEKAADKSTNSAELIEKMTAQYPDLDDVSSLELSAKVIKGEMQWPQ
nr:MBL fold metallo-hydrolase [uncultured Moellerella sp.]